MVIRLMRDAKCRKCNKTVKHSFKVVAAHKLEAELCQDCYNAWFDHRDKMVADAFREFIPPNKTK